MSPRDPAIRLHDILEAIQSAQDYTEGMTFADFQGDRKTREAVLFNIMVIGEAASSLAANPATASTGIPWDKMKAMRNLIVHAYFGIRADILWQTVKQDLPPLVPLIRVLLDKK